MRSSVRSYATVAALLVVVLLVVVNGQQALLLRAVYARTATGAAVTSAPVAVAPTEGTPAGEPDRSLAAPVFFPVEAATQSDPAATIAPPETPIAAPTEEPTPVPATPAPPTRVPATPAPVIPAPVVAAPTAAPAGCPSTWFCYPRLGIAGAIVPYTDCSGGTDVGTSIRAYSCLSPNYLMGHAYTQMGKLTGWQAGDVVYAYGQAYTVYGAITEQSCQAPHFPLAALSMQTSLSANTCGPVLVVQAR